MTASQYLLSDQQMKQYLAAGCLPLKSSLPAEVHQRIYQRTDEVFAQSGNPGNNLLPFVPEIKKVFDDPVVVGALTSVLGPDYVMHSHRHPHINPIGSDGGGWHKDSYWGFRKVRSHRTRWAMIFYYPQDTSLENGPTAVMSGTHCFEKRAASEAEEHHLPLVGEAGSMALVHFDLWHRAMPNQADYTRYMMKFQFTRMQEPSAPTWNAQGGTWQPEDGSFMSARHWDWHCGGGIVGGDTVGEGNGRAVDALAAELADEDPVVRLRASSALGFKGAEATAAIEALAGALRDEKEPVRLNAAYALSAMGATAIAPLREALDDEMEEAQLAAAHGLAQAGWVAVPALLEALQSDGEPARGYAAFALGDMGSTAGDDAVQAVARLAQDPSEWVRRSAVEALGTMESSPQDAVPALSTLLADEDGQTRYEAAYALARFGAQAADAVPALIAALNDDDNRYVGAHSATALRRIGTPEANGALLDYLSAAQWCSMTTKESTF